MEGSQVSVHMSRGHNSEDIILEDQVAARKFVSGRKGKKGRRKGSVPEGVY